MNADTSRMTGSRTWRVAVALTAFALLAAGCGGGDDDSASDDTTTSSSATTTTKPSNTPSNNPKNDAAIEQLQRELNSLGCNAGPIDGEIGPDTEAGIRQFQTAAGISVDGIVGSQTRAALAQASASGSPNCRNTPVPPSTSATTTTTSGGNQPNCNGDLINPAVAASLLPTEKVVNSGPFECSGNWATVAPNVQGEGGPEITITVLLLWNGSAWQVVDRAVYCANGSVPQQIYQQACESN